MGALQACQADIIKVAMNLSGILVAAPPDDIETVVQSLSQLPGVIFAELVYHYPAEDDAIVNFPPSGLDALGEIPESVLQHLNQ